VATVIGRLRERLRTARHRGVLIDTLLSFATKVASAGLSFTMFVALARAMDLEAYGVFSASFSLAILLAVLGSVGQRTAALRMAAVHDQRGEPELRTGAIRHGYALVLAGCGLVGLGAIGVSALRGGGAPAPEIVAVAALVVALGVAEYQGHVFRVTGHVLLALLPRDVIWRGAVTVAGFAAAFGLAVRWSAATWLWVLVATLAAVAAGQFLVHLRRHPDASPFRPARFQRGRWMSASWGLWASSVLLVSAGSLSVILIERMVGAEQAGTYFVALRSAQLLNLFVLASKVVTMPTFSRQVAAGAWGEAQRVATLSAVLSGGFAAVGFLAYLVGGGYLLRLFGAEYAAATPVLLVLSGGFAVAAMAGPAEPLLQMSGHDRPYLVLLAIANGVAVGSLFLTIPAFGILGAAGSVAAGQVLLVVLARAYAVRALRIDPTVLSGYTRRR
jgi:O-antigen/teichoic acid export membrane protein